MKKLIIFVVMLLIASMSVFAQDYTLNVGDSHTYQFGGYTFQINVNSVSGNYATFTVNGITVATYIDSLLALPGGYRLQLKGTTSSSVTFRINSPAPNYYCFDTDNGKDFDSKGRIAGISTIGENFDMQEYCNGNYVHEYYCKTPDLNGDNIEQMNYYFVDTYCPYGCSNGACMPKQPETIGPGEPEPAEPIGADEPIPPAPIPGIDLGDYPEMFLSGSKFNAVGVIGDTAPASDVIAMIDILEAVRMVSSDGTIRRIDVGAAKLASTIADPTKQNIISVGNPCNNKVTRQLEGYPSTCKKGLVPGEGMIKLYKQNNYYQIVVTGYNDDDVRKAAKVLANWRDYNLEGSVWHITGTLNNPIVRRWRVSEEEVETTPAPSSSSGAGASSYLVMANLGEEFSLFEYGSHTEKPRRQTAIIQGTRYDVQLVSFSGDRSLAKLKLYDKTTGVSSDEEYVGIAIGDSFIHKDIKIGVIDIVDKGTSGRVDLIVTKAGGYEYEDTKTRIEPAEIIRDEIRVREIRSEEYCDGCKKEDACLGIGLRTKDAAGDSLYCDLDKALKLQKYDNAVCENNFECKSNSCMSGKCVDLQKQLEQQQNMLDKILRWLSRIF